MSSAIAKRKLARQRRRRRRRAASAVLAVLAVAVAAAAVVSATTGGQPGPVGAAAGVGATGVRGVTRRPRAAPATRRGPGSGGRPVAVARHKAGTARVPILMYHVINRPPAGAPFPGLYVAPSQFAEQMRALRKAGYHPVTMDQLLANWRAGAPLPPGRPIVLSFDNGYESQYTNALPILRSYGWVGVENIQLSGLPPSQGGLTRAQVRGLIAAGWELDTQGYSHAELPALTPAELRFQVAVARAIVRRRYGVPVNWFCYPSGHYDAAVVAQVRAAGYVGATTVVPGWASPSDSPYTLPRLRVLGGTSGQALLGLIAAIRKDPPPPSSYL